MRTVSVLLIAILGFLTGFISAAEAQWRYQFCKEDSWSVIETADLERKGFELIRERMQQAVYGVLKDTGRLADVLVTDCPLDGLGEIGLQILPEQLASIGIPYMREKRRYKLYFTTLLLEEIAHDELVHRAVTEACTIRTGIYDDRLTPWTDKVTISIIKCRIETAERMGEFELARWLRRYLRDG